MALLTVLLSTAVAPAAPAAVTLPAGSVTTNPSFESGLSGWSGYTSTLSRVTASDAPAGAYVAKVTRSSGSYFTIDDEPNTIATTVAGTVHRAEAWVRSASASSNGKPIYIRVRERSPSGAVVREWSSSAGTLGSTYVPLRVSATAVNSGDTLDVRVSQTSAGTGNAFFVDGVTLTGGGAAPPPPPPPPSFEDLTPPSVDLTSPAQGAVLVGGVPVTANAADDVGVDRVEFYVNGQLRWTERYAPYKLGTSGTWDTTAEPNGAYTIEARAFDLAGNVTSSRRSVTVDNPPPVTGLDPAAYPFDPKAAFNQPIPADAGSDPRSDAIIGQLKENMTISRPFLGSTGEMATVYEVAPTDPWYTTSVGGRGIRFRVPANAVSGGGSDNPLVLLDPNHPDLGPFTELRLWQATINTSAKTITANGAGLFKYNNDGALMNGVRSVGQPFLGWGTGWGLSMTSGLVRPEEVRAGEIRHALRFAYSNRDFTNQYRAPAIKTDQPKGTTTRNPATAMDMGMRLQLDPSVNCATRTVPDKPDTSPETRMLRMVCRALQRYGMIASDGTADRNLLIFMENTVTADWTSVIGQPRNDSYGHLIRDVTSPSDGLPRDENSGIPWGRMRVLATSTFPTG